MRLGRPDVAITVCLALSLNACAPAESVPLTVARPTRTTVQRLTRTAPVAVSVTAATAWPLPTWTQVTTAQAEGSPTSEPTGTSSVSAGQPAVFAAGGVDGQLDVFYRDPQGLVLNLTRHPSADAYPSLSPDGTRVVFSSNRDGPSRLYVVSVDGSGLQRLTQSSAGDTLPAWSPDGAAILYQTLLPDHNWEIYVMRPDGSEATNLTHHPAIDTSAAWSPDGSRIAYESNRDGDFEIYVIHADGSGQTNLTQKAEAQDIAATWSDDGTRILFRSDRDGPLFTYRPYVMAADGSDARSMSP